MSVLGFTDDPVELVPGSVVGVVALHDHWASRARTAADAATRLAAVTVAGWSGDGADAFAARVREASARWTRLSDAFLAAARAVDGYGSTLGWAQGQAVEAIDLWEQGREADVASPADGSSPFEVAPQPSVLILPGPGEHYRDQARSVLAAATAQVLEAGDLAASALRSAAAEPDVDDRVWAALGGVSPDPDSALALLAGLSGDEIRTLLGLRPELRDLLAQSDPRGVATWWAGLDDDGRATLIQAEPAFIGDLEGVDYTSRDRANRLALDDQLADARAEVAALEAAAPAQWSDQYVSGEVPDPDLDTARQRLAALENIRDALSPDVNGPDRFLVSLSDDVPPLAAVSIGDLDTAADVTYAVPGMNTYTTDMTGWATASQNIQWAQDQNDPGTTHAVVAWIGYETPPIPVTGGGFDVMGMARADDGAERFAAAVLGLDAARAADPPVLNVVAHSYGTPTVAEALTMPGVSVDAFVSLGSAGLPADIDSATDLDADAVYAGQAQNVLPYLEPGQGDQWAQIGRLSPEHPNDPTDPSFGAQVFGADGDNGMARVTDHNVLIPDGEPGHGYLSRGTESLLNVALATTGQPDLMTDAVPKGLTDIEKAILMGVAIGASL